MKRAIALTLLLLPVTLGVAGCDTEAADPAGDPQTGTVELFLSAVPVSGTGDGIASVGPQVREVEFDGVERHGPNLGVTLEGAD